MNEEYCKDSKYWEIVFIKIEILPGLFFYYAVINEQE